tara:strand:+ start:12322 stop:12582 length:261 start_codon:yes stop_codon:yes gene_type:complete
VAKASVSTHPKKEVIMNSKEFSLKIESIVKEKRITYMDAVIWYCEQNDIDPGTVSSLVSKSLKEKIKVEAIDLRMLNTPKGGILPV